jgi:predicted RNase H-like HicB family nuclease
MGLSPHAASTAARSEARRNIREAIRQHVGALLAHGEPVLQVP